MTRTIYLAGPMRGCTLFNFPAFDAARDRLAKLGWHPVSPADMDRKAGFDPDALPEDWDWHVIPETLDVAAVIRRDTDAILACPFIYMLNGWERSEGARLEHGLAILLRKRIIYEAQQTGLCRLQEGGLSLCGCDGEEIQVSDGTIRYSGPGEDLPCPE